MPDVGQTGKDGSVANGQRVLVVDGLHEIQDVLRTVLGPKGLRVDWIRSHCESIPGDSESKPDILVIDAETCRERPEWHDIPHVMLENEVTDQATGTTRAILRKPFQFPDLINAIERLLPTQIP